MSTPSDTPRADAHEKCLQTFRNATRTFADHDKKFEALKDIPLTWDDFARTLERELNAALARVAELQMEVVAMRAAIQQLADARSEATALRVTEANLRTERDRLREVLEIIRCDIDAVGDEWLSQQQDGIKAIVANIRKFARAALNQTTTNQ